jgi:hypothetical protein
MFLPLMANPPRPSLYTPGYAHAILTLPARLISRLHVRFDGTEARMTMAEDRMPVKPKRHTNHEVEITKRQKQKTHPAVLALARLIGRQMAREHFAALQAANDNRASCHPAADPPGQHETFGKPDTS